jgi:hypothetical protein
MDFSIIDFNSLLVLFPYGKFFLSAKYKIFSEGIIFLNSLTTDSEPNPESKTAIGLYNIINSI